MARYSSDSDSDRSGKYRSRRYHRRSRSSSSESSDSSPHRKRSSKHTKSRRHKRSRSKSRERSSKSYKSSRTSSRDRRRYKSPERNKKKTRSASKEKHTRSLSREKSTSRSSSSQSCVKSADKSVNILAKDEFSIEPRISESIIDEINSAGFTPKQFTSSAQTREKKSNKNIVIDISADTIQVSTMIKPSSAINDSIFHTSIMMDQEARFDRWVKKLHNFRQKAIAELSTNLT